MQSSQIWGEESLNADLEGFFEALEHAVDHASLARINGQLKKSPTLWKQFCHCLDGSKFIQNQLLSRPQLIEPTLESIEASVSIDDQFLSKQWREQTREFTDELTLDILSQQLRQFRNMVMVHIIWRDLNRLCSLSDTTLALSLLAETCISIARDYHAKKLTTRWGEPQDSQGSPQKFYVLAMGKLGAYELNLSSDIDLIFLYPDKGNTAGGEADSVSNQEYFERLGKNIIKTLDQKTADGFVFRVDMRLRPFGQSGPLATSFDALELYLQTQGREWERYAMVKARAISDDPSSSTRQRLQQLITSFTFRKYIDFSVIDALRKLKHMINQEVKRRNLEDDVKLGAGGIREIEFIVQVFQLIRGGREIDLQDNRIMPLFSKLAEYNYIPEDRAEKLKDAYIFLRNTEHAIQAYEDEQTQKLPSSGGNRERLARMMQTDNWEAFYAALNSHRSFVRQEFEGLIAAPEEKRNQDTEDPSESERNALVDSCETLWTDKLEGEENIQLLRSCGHEDAEQSLALLEELRNCHSVSQMQHSSRDRLDTFMPRLLVVLSNSTTPTQTLKRILNLVKAVARRSAYLILLIENPGALEQLVRLSQASPWIADQLAEHPALLDELLDARSLYRPPAKEELEDELRRDSLRLSKEDLEAQMEMLRYFRSSHALRVAASEVTGALPLMKVSDYLSDLAEVIVRYCLQLSWSQMTAKHGVPDGDNEDQPNFVVIAYGKLGGLELNHGSDLDLVFMHNTNGNAYTNVHDDAQRSIDNLTFYTRLGQKLIHLLTTQLASGKLYEVDMRLRPSGNSGMLVSSLRAFRDYQEDSAWTWEHQALVRARCIAGSHELKQDFERVRLQVLCKERSLPALRKDVIEMRQKMRAHLGSPDTGGGSESFHIKQDPGGIVDIEFMVQYAVLAWSAQEPALAHFTDNIRILEQLAKTRYLDQARANSLIEAYKALRIVSHRLTLQQLPSKIEWSVDTKGDSGGKLLPNCDIELDFEELNRTRTTVSKLWQAFFSDE